MIGGTKMKNRYLYIIAFVLMIVGLSSCSLNETPYDATDTGDSYKTLTDVRNGMNGAYYALGQYEFLGNYAICLSDMCAGVSTGSAASGHMLDYSNFTFAESASELEDMWNYGFKVIDRTTRTIKGAKQLIAAGSISDLKQANAYLGQCYALKALANYYLVNLFALPYSDANKTSLGLPLVKDEPVDALTKVARSTVDETYTQILSDLTAAESAFANASSVTSAYYMGPMGLKALEARVYMSMGQYDKAEAAAKEAISLKGKGDGTATDVAPSNEGYISMWTSTAISDEDIFTIVKSDNDNLSSNSLNTIYNAYYCTTQKVALKLFADTDIRKNLFVESSSAGGTQPTKFRGTATNAAVNNIPIFRKSEMSLIIAECEARIGTVSEAQNYLLYTAKRNTAIQTVGDLPSTSADLLQFISQERIREFFEEGHRFYDARRMGDKINADNYSGFDIQKFVFPIPEAEINAGFGITQNTGWEDNLPAI